MFNKLFLRVSQWAVCLAACLLGAHPAQAVPSFARQTGSECAACHIGAFGPHLTPYGVRFKLGGYQDSDGKEGNLPLSAQLRASYNDLATPNDKSTTRLDEASLFLAGKLGGKLGAYIKATYTNDPFNAGSKEGTALGNMDIRLADSAQWQGKDLQFGLSLNNNPGTQDPLDAMPAWGFPALGTTGSLFNPTTSGGLPHRALGLTGYVHFDNHWYAELGGYRSLSRSQQDSLGLDPQGDPGAFSGIAPYWRLAYMHDMKTQSFSAGVFGLSVERQLAVTNPAPLTTVRSGPDDKLRDLGFDAVYEYLGTREHVLQLRGAVIKEHRNYGSTPTNFFGATALPSGTLTETTLAATYVYGQTWGLTAAKMSSRASADPVRYFPNPTPDSRARYAEVFWTPWGKESSWAAPWANLRLAAVWTHFDKFNGGTHDIFGSAITHQGVAMDPADLNSFQIYAQVAF